MNNNNTLVKVAGSANVGNGTEYEPQQQANGYLQPANGHNLHSDEEKIRRISGYFTEILHVFGLDPTGEEMSATPRNMATMYVKEIFGGLDPKNRPVISTVNNKYHYNQVLLERNISIRSFCAHHLLPITGRAHIAYIPAGKIMEASQLSELVQYYCSKPQVMEKLITQLADELKSILEMEDIAIVITASHFCKQLSAGREANNDLVSSFYSGKFNREETRNEFLALIK